jgi:hypothetical protein
MFGLVAYHPTICSFAPFLLSRSTIAWWNGMSRAIFSSSSECGTANDDRMVTSWPDSERVPIRVPMTRGAVDSAGRREWWVRIEARTEGWTLTTVGCRLNDQYALSLGTRGDLRLRRRCRRKVQVDSGRGSFERHFRFKFILFSGFYRYCARVWRF